MKKRVHVVGAGFAGLTVSLRLAQKGFDVDLYERSTRVGGLLGTEITEHGLVEQAANALIRTYKAEALFQELGITPCLPLKDSKKRFIFRGSPRRWPLSILETCGLIFRFLPRFVFAKSNLFPQSAETLRAWGLRHLGKPGTELLLGPAMQGIYGNDATHLSASLILGPAFTRKQKTGAYRGLLTGPEGMQNLVDRLEARVRELGVRIHLNSEVNISELPGPVVIATSAPAASRLLQEKFPALAALLGKIQTTSLLTATLFFKKAQETYKGFGCLVPQIFGFKTLGVLMNSYIFEGRNKSYNETWILGGSEAQGVLDTSDENILKVIAEERFRLLGSKEGLLDYRIRRWKQALPFYDLELESILRELPSQTPSGIYLHGNYLGGIGLSKILDRSDLLAEEISNHEL